MNGAKGSMAKACFACALSVAILVLVAGIAAPAAYAGEVASDGVYEIKDDVSSLVENSQVSQQPYSFSGTTMMPDSYQDIVLVQWSGSFPNLASHPIHAGDYLKVSLDPKLKLYGYLDPDEVKFPDLISTEDGTTVVAESHYDADEHAVYYVFTDFVNGAEGKQLESLAFETYAVLSINRAAVPTSGSYTFSNTFGKTSLAFAYNVSYASKLPEPILNQAYEKYELTASCVKLDWVNPLTGVYEQSFFVGPVDKGDQTIPSRRSADFGFEIFGQTTPAQDADVTVYQVVGAPDSFPDNFVIPSSALVDVTDKFTVTRSDTGGLTFAPKSPGATPATSYYYIHVRNGFDVSRDFDSGMTVLNYVDGAPVSDMAKVSVGNQFTKDQLAGLARPVYGGIPGKSLTIKKVAEDGSPLSGAVFTVRSADGTQVDRVTVGDDGTAKTKVLPLGTYTIHEEQAPEGYAAAADATASLSDQENFPVEVTVVDEKIEQPGESSGGGGGSDNGGGEEPNGDTGTVPQEDDGGDDPAQDAASEPQGGGASRKEASVTPRTYDQPLAVVVGGAAVLAGALALFVRLRVN